MLFIRFKHMHIILICTYTISRVDVDYIFTKLNNMREPLFTVGFMVSMENQCTFIFCVYAIVLLNKHILKTITSKIMCWRCNA